MINFKINGKKFQSDPGKTILEVAEENGIKIPTLCHDKELKPFGSCWICAVQVKSRKGFVTACGTEVLEGMEITTTSEEIHRARKMALELLLSDHYADCEAPCRVACPDKVDVQAYVSLIANGQYHEAVKVIKENLPLPLSIGRVCPAFCEQECRRTIVEEPVAIRQLKRFAADFDLNDSWSYIPEREADKGKKIAVVGGGPSGLTCGYYLSNRGYDVTVFEAAAKAGGWLRYGIPEYRLPKEILDKEIELLCANGMKIKTGILIGKDITLHQLSKDYDALYLALGAQNAVPMRIKGSDLKGCFLGVDFLKDFVLGNKPKLGKKVAVVGGGNTAIDCARTARRMGSEVTIVYRRTRQEMPAESYEVDAAEEEGIRFHFLTNPVENLGKKGRLTSVKMEKMKLGEPDDSGRRRPEPTGEFFIEEYDSLIAAISQIPEVGFVTAVENRIDGKEIPLTRWSTAIVDEKNMYLGFGNVFAGGDFRRGPATAIEAVADGRLAAETIASFLEDKSIELKQPEFDAKKEKKLIEVDPAHFRHYTRINRFRMPELEPEIRAKDFAEVELGFTEVSARAEADRCLECGCQVNTTCKLRQYATAYDIQPDLFRGTKNKHPIDQTHPFILRDPNKCIKCGRCVRICAEVQGPGVLGYIYRGFPSYVAPEFGESLKNTTCESCGKCIEVCPVGALLPRNLHYKLNPHEVDKITQNCGLCGTGCKIDVYRQTDKVTYINPAEEPGFNDRNLCFAGKFGWQMLEDKDRVKMPYLRIEENLESKEGPWRCLEKDQVRQMIGEALAKASTRRIYISPQVTCEEMLLMQTIAEKTGTQISSLSYTRSFIEDLHNTSISQKTYADLEQAEVIFIVGKISHTLKILARTQQRQGKKLVLLTNEKKEFNSFADELFDEDQVTDTMDRILEYYYDENDGEDTEREDRPEPIELELPKKTLFLYCREYLSEEAVWDIWLLASLVCDFSEGSGVLATSEYNNLKGLQHLGIKPGKPEKSDFIILYGEHPCEDQRKMLKNSHFILSINTHLEESDPGHVILPLPSYLEIEGTALANDERMIYFHNPKKSILFQELLSLFLELGLITPSQANPSYWLQKTREILSAPYHKKEMNDQQLYEYLNSVEDISFQIPKITCIEKKRVDALKKLTKH
ncbi:MAG: FAD-dependent oxidoreductase [Candidatus Cloacimonetes bacterium]|nr:FAD-dependent oxidoreductase [Candidatus Cloacimonadota bacterium]